MRVPRVRVPRVHQDAYIDLDLHGHPTMVRLFPDFVSTQGDKEHMCSL